MDDNLRYIKIDDGPKKRVKRLPTQINELKKVPRVPRVVIGKGHLEMPRNATMPSKKIYDRKKEDREAGNDGDVNEEG